MKVSPLIKLGPDNPVKPVVVKLDIGKGELTNLTMYVSSNNELVGVSDMDTLAAWLQHQNLPSGEQIRVIDKNSIPDSTKRDIKFFSDSPCWFEGCEELRTQYQDELTKLESANCKSCEKGALIRKYLKLLAERQDT